MRDIHRDEGEDRPEAERKVGDEVAHQALRIV
jgi:hypothetical protein